MTCVVHRVCYRTKITYNCARAQNKEAAHSQQPSLNEEHTHIIRIAFMVSSIMIYQYGIINQGRLLATGKIVLQMKKVAKTKFFNFVLQGCTNENQYKLIE